MFTGGDPGAGYSPDPPTRGKKIDVKISNRRFVIYFILSIVLFILMLIILSVVEMAGRTQAHALF